jgi:hypothetical protein
MSKPSVSYRALQSLAIRVGEAGNELGERRSTGGAQRDLEGAKRPVNLFRGQDLRT